MYNRWFTFLASVLVLLRIVIPVMIGIVLYCLIIEDLVAILSFSLATTWLVLLHRIIVHYIQGEVYRQFYTRIRDLIPDAKRVLDSIIRPKE